MSPTTDTIAAIATAPGQAGVGIIRVSGPAAAAIACSVLGFMPKPRYAHYGPFLEANGRGYWDTSEENLERLRTLYSEVEDKIEGVE